MITHDVHQLLYHRKVDLREGEHTNLILHGSNGILPCQRTKQFLGSNTCCGTLQIEVVTAALGVVIDPRVLHLRKRVAKMLRHCPKRSNHASIDLGDIDNQDDFFVRSAKNDMVQHLSHWRCQTLDRRRKMRVDLRMKLRFEWASPLSSASVTMHKLYCTGTYTNAAPRCRAISPRHRRW